MWLRLTERARKAVAYAQNDARLSPDLLTLACVRESGGLAGKLLAGLDVDVEALIEQLEALTPDEGSESDELIEAAEQEARGLNSPYIGPEHLLLGILRIGTSQAARVLMDAGVDHDNAKAAVAALMVQKGRDEA